MGISTVVELEWALNISISVNELFRDAMNTLNHFVFITSLYSHHGLVLVIDIESIFLQLVCATAVEMRELLSHFYNQSIFLDAGGLFLIVVNKA